MEAAGFIAIIIIIGLIMLIVLADISLGEPVIIGCKVTDIIIRTEPTFVGGSVGGHFMVITTTEIHLEVLPRDREQVPSDTLKYVEMEIEAGPSVAIGNEVVLVRFKGGITRTIYQETLYKY